MGATQDESARWPQLLATATTASQVLAVANEYLARLAPADVAQLPPECRPRALVREADIGAYAFELKGCRYADAKSERIGLRLAAWLADASLRLTALAMPLPPQARANDLRLRAFSRDAA